ncbi:MAG: SPASM domain-containing protein, partial [Candidatus Omnitrophota bacterium]|nr:SPASM domain-containing protein [Candidatus Omnitrophota bacterium]
DLRKMIVYAKGIGVGLVDVSTNGMYNMSDVVLGTSLSEIIVSLEADKKTHEMLRPGASWEKIVMNLENLYYQRKRGNYQWPIIRLQIIDLPENHDKIPQFIDWGLNYADTVYVKKLETMRASLGNRLISDDKATSILENRRPCKLLWFSLTVTSSGEISACCHDPHNKSVLGNINEMTIKEAWLKLAEIRQRHRRGDYSDFNGLCRQCLDFKNW